MYWAWTKEVKRVDKHLKTIERKEQIPRLEGMNKILETSYSSGCMINTDNDEVKWETNDSERELGG